MRQEFVQYSVVACPTAGTESLPIAHYYWSWKESSIWRYSFFVLTYWGRVTHIHVILAPSHYLEQWWNIISPLARNLMIRITSYRDGTTWQGTNNDCRATWSLLEFNHSIPLRCHDRKRIVTYINNVYFHTSVAQNASWLGVMAKKGNPLNLQCIVFWKDNGGSLTIGSSTRQLLFTNFLCSVIFLIFHHGQNTGPTDSPVCCLYDIAW